MEDLSLHILDIAENSLAGGATRIEILVEEDTGADSLLIEIRDNGRGMSEAMLATVKSPFTTTRSTRRVGLGLALLDEASQQAEGNLDIHSEAGRGTTVTARMRLSHIDRKPLGNLAETVAALVSYSPQTELVFLHRRNGQEVRFDTAEVREAIGPSSPLNGADVLTIIKHHLNEEERQLSQSLP